jgi:ribosomal protein S25
MVDYKLRRAVMPNPNTVITEKELAKVAKLAQRKTGVTVSQVIDAFQIKKGRAANMLRKLSETRSDVKVEAAGAKAGRAAKTLVYTIAK